MIDALSGVFLIIGIFLLSFLLAGTSPEVKVVGLAIGCISFGISIGFLIARIWYSLGKFKERETLLPPRFP